MENIGLDMKNHASHLLIYFLFIFLTLHVSAQEDYYITENGYVHFISEAPLETIEAESDFLRGVIDSSTNKFAFSLEIETFEGFNSPLQQEHFYENFMETQEFDKSTFQGKIIEDINYNVDTIYAVRAKGTLIIHGKSQDRIIESTMEIRGGELIVKANFSVLLADHDITIPRIVKQKISEEIKVTVNATLVNK